MATKYLEVNSTYRNRTLWPNPGEFEVLICKTGQRTSSNAEDPVSKAAPTFSFTSNLFEAITPGTTGVSGDIILTGIGQGNSTKVLVFETSAGELQQAENYYKHAVVSFAVSNERVRILRYDYMGNNKGKLIIDKDVIVEAGDTIRLEDPTDFSDPSFVHVFVPNGSNSPEDYRFSLLYNESLDQFRPIAGYDVTLGTLTLDGDPVIGWLATHQYSIRKERPSSVTTAAIGSTTTAVVLATGSTSIGQFLRIPKTIYDNTTVPPQGESRRVIAYNPNTSVATVSPGFTADPTGLRLEVLPFSYDNFYPFIYNGSKQSELSAYEIRLNSLVVPNQILAVGNGGKVAFYPFLYVQLSIEGQATDIMYSNNPNARHTLFKASVPNMQNLTESTFIKLEGDADMIQTVRFKTETNFKFKVTLPNGEVFATMMNDSFSPLEPNPLIQISALFELKRI